MSSNTSECLSAAYKAKTTLSYRIKYIYIILFDKVHNKNTLTWTEGELW